jgi:ASC-1-like (ASCH) protein
MKSWTLRFRAVDKADFEAVRKGTKSVETRAATVRYKPIEAGDTLVFVCAGKKFSKKISKKEHFKSIDAMVKKISYKKIMPSVGSIEEMKEVYDSYPGYKEKIQKFGILAFHLKEA